MSLVGSEQSPEAAREKQAERDMHRNNTADGRDPWQDNGQMRPAYIREMTNHQLDQGTINLLSNLLSQDFVLANFSSAEMHEIRWLARQILIEVEDLHPNQRSVFSGEFRKYFFEDSRGALKPLDDAQRATLFQFLQGCISRATRGKEGWQQEQLTKVTKVSEVHNGNDSKKSKGWL